MCLLSQYKHQQNRRLLLPIPMDHCNGHNCIVLSLQVYTENACMHVMGSIVYITWCKTVLEKSLVECWLSNVLDVCKCSLSDSTFTCNEMKTCSWCQCICHAFIHEKWKCSWCQCIIHTLIPFRLFENVWVWVCIYTFIHAVWNFGCQCIYTIHSCNVKVFGCEGAYETIQSCSVRRCMMPGSWYHTFTHAVWSVHTMVTLGWCVQWDEK